MLTQEETQVLQELIRLADPEGVVKGRKLRDAGFAEFVASVNQADVGYPQAEQSRRLQILRDKGYIKMERRDGGTYTIARRPGM